VTICAIAKPFGPRFGRASRICAGRMINIF